MYLEFGNDAKTTTNSWIFTINYVLDTLQKNQLSLRNCEVGYGLSLLQRPQS
jgi:hypothetical protein